MPTDLNRDAYAEQPPIPPQEQVLAHQEPGIRWARALPYALHAEGQLLARDHRFRIKYINVGDAGAVFQVRSAKGAQAPRRYTAEPDVELVDSWNIAGDSYDLSVYGPNGFLRVFKGHLHRGGGANLLVRAEYSVSDPGMGLAGLS